MKKCIIMTTAILRPELHTKTIGSFYKEYYTKYYNYLEKKLEIYHIINIDSPNKLKEHFTLENTIENFKKIIPSTVHMYFITPEEPSFSKAFQNIMKKIEELNLIHPDNYYFWFEDDWILTKEYNFFETILNVMKFKCCALSNTLHSQCGSFRGGPVMNGTYFIRYFNLEKIGYFSNDKDPERQICRWIGKYQNFCLKDRYIKEEDKKIKLLLVNPLHEKYDLEYDFGLWFYSRKFNKHIEISQDVVFFEDLHIFNTNKKVKYNNTIVDYNNVIKDLDSDHIVYIVLKPYNFEDCGREFAEKYKLKKWENTNNITYS